MKTNKHGGVSFWDNPKNAEKVNRYKRNSVLNQYRRGAMTSDQLNQSFNNMFKKDKK